MFQSTQASTATLPPSQKPLELSKKRGSGYITKQHIDELIEKHGVAVAGPVVHCGVKVKWKR